MAASNGLAYGRPCPPRGGLAHGPANHGHKYDPGAENNQPTTHARSLGRKICCVPEWTQRRRRRSMEHGDTGPPPRQRSGRLVPLMRSVAHTATRPPSQGPASALRYNYRGGTAEKRFSAGEIVHVQKNPKEPIFWSGQLESTWRGAVAGGTLIFTHIDGCGFEPRHARSFLFVGFWCFGAQDAARANRRVVRGCTAKSCEFRGWPRFAFPPRFFSMCVLRFMALGER